MTRLLIASLAAICASIVDAQSLHEPAGADLIVFNAKIFTGNLAQPEASALAVKNGRIYSVGSDDEIIGLKNSSTKVIDADGRRLIPGISDAHTHVLNESGYTYNVRWDGVPTLSQALAMLREQAERTPEGHWVKGGVRRAGLRRHDSALARHPSRLVACQILRCIPPTQLS